MSHKLLIGSTVMTMISPLPKFQYFLDYARQHAFDRNEVHKDSIKEPKIAPLDHKSLSSHILVWEKPHPSSGKGDSEEILFSWEPIEKTFRSIYSHCLYRYKWNEAGHQSIVMKKQDRRKYLRQRDRCEIVRRVSAGEKQAHLAKEFGVSRAAVCYLLKHQKQILQRSAPQ